MSGTLVAGAAPIKAAGFKAMNWIDGAWVDSAKRTKSFDPATGEEIGTFADASHAEWAPSRRSRSAPHSNPVAR